MHVMFATIVWAGAVAYELGAWAFAALLAGTVGLMWLITNGYAVLVEEQPCPQIEG
jgi:hypothetical protein